MSNKSRKIRNFALISYLNEDKILSVLNSHDSQIKAYAYILHDKDIREDGSLKEPHFHILLALYNATTCNSVVKWFQGFTDNNDLSINSFCEPMHNISCCFEYLTHNTENAIQDNKYIYDESFVKGFNVDFFIDKDLQDTDNLSLALSEMINGVPLIEIAKRYGRDFVIHYGHIRQLFNDVQKQTGGECFD
ncbi:MAG: hypothetical protein IJA41_04515 [Clostridia bacterium]|nr:hypothetical protein [Clostridia bacterium]